MDLSILIPTYNRPDWVQRQLLFFQKMQQNGLIPLAYEIVISDNHSTPSVESVIGRFSKSLPIKIIKPPEHYPTAEQNLHFGLGRCAGRYVWTLGDDDPPFEQGFKELVSEVKKNEQDIVIFNSNAIRLDGSIFEGVTRCTYPEKILTIGDFVKNSGFWFSIAGFSNSLFRRPDAASLAVLAENMSVSKIYAHVFWLIETFWNAKFKYVPTPLVCYSERDTAESDHWPSLAKKHGVFRNYYWTLGFCRQVKRLRHTIGLPIGWTRTVWTFHWTGLRLPALNHVASTFCSEILHGEEKTNSEPRSITGEEFIEMSDFLIEENPMFGALCNSLKTIFLRKPGKEEAKEYVNRFQPVLWSQPLADFYHCSHKKWNICNFDAYFIAVHQGLGTQQILECLRDLTPFSQPGFLVADTLAQLITKIDNEKEFHPPESHLPMHSQNQFSYLDLAQIRKILSAYNKVKRLVPYPLRKASRTLLK